MFGPLDKFFDFNGDGKLGAFERGAELDFLDQMSRESPAHDTAAGSDGSRIEDSERSFRRAQGRQDPF